MKRNLLLGVFLVFCSVASAQSIDPARSIVEFKVSNMGFMTVSGTLGGMKGTVNFDTDNLKDSFFDVSVDPTTINTNSKKRDDHLKEEDFFNVAEFLAIRFISSEIIKTPEGLVAKGTLSLRGETRNIAIPFTQRQEPGETIFKGEIQIDREDYKLGTDKYSGAFMIGSTVEVTINCVLTE